MTVEQTRQAIETHYALSPSDAPVVQLKGHGRTSLASLYPKLGFKHGLELGVWDGQHAEWVCQLNPEVELLCVDAWERFAVKVNHPSPSRFVREQQKARQRLAPYRTTILPMFSDEAAALVQDRSLDFIFIDASHGYLDVLCDITRWAPKIKSGGIVSGHDYETTVLGWPPENGVKEAVHTYIGSEGIAPVYVLMGTSRDRWKSYFWISP